MCILKYFRDIESLSQANKLLALVGRKSRGQVLLRLFMAATIYCMGAGVSAQNWPQWRGPTGDGIAASGSYPVNFSATDDLVWKAELPGKGSSTPIVWNNQIIITSGIGDDEEGEDGVLCYDWTGKKLWQVKLGKQDPGKHPRGSGSCPSIVTDGTRLFAYFKSATLAALDLDGNILWKKNLQEMFGEISLFWDLGTSPVLAGEMVIVAVMHGGSSYLLALDKQSGEVVWKIDRNYECAMESDQSYTTPIVVKESGGTTLVVWGADHLTGHDIYTGKLLWQAGGFNPDNKVYWRTIASPAILNDIAVVPYGRGKYLAGVKIGGSGDITDSGRIWEKKGIGTDVATPVAQNGKVYLTSFKGNVSCLDVQSGEVIWQDKLPRGGGMFYSSPVLAGNKMYICREEGAVYVCELTQNGIKVLNQAEFDDFFVATPVLVKNKIILRGEKYLYCIGPEK